MAKTFLKWLFALEPDPVPASKPPCTSGSFVVGDEVRIVQKDLFTTRILLSSESYRVIEVDEQVPGRIWLYKDGSELFALNEKSLKKVLR